MIYDSLIGVKKKALAIYPREQADEVKSILSG
jgi:hypothetical protein